MGECCFGGSRQTGTGARIGHIPIPYSLIGPQPLGHQRLGWECGQRQQPFPIPAWLPCTKLKAAGALRASLRAAGTFPLPSQ